MDRREEGFDDEFNIRAVIMAGGEGTRLWPLSRASHPKQFLNLYGKQTMLQSALERIDQLNISSSVTICNQAHRFLVAEQLRAIDQLGSIILEPTGKNTAPAVAIAALTAKEDPLLLVLPADHVILDKISFTNTVRKATSLAASGKLVTLGVNPNSAHTGYGYIKMGEKCGKGFIVDDFFEKPSSHQAHEYIESGNYLWNSGIFLFKSSCYLEELKKFRPDIHEACLQTVNSSKKDLDFLRLDNDVFSECPSESIDYAVMEKTTNAVVVNMEAGWSDLGSWSSLWDVSKKDNEGNATIGDVLMNNTKDCYIRSEHKLVTTAGIDDMVIVDTKDALMVAHKESIEAAKIISQDLKTQDRNEWKHHREVHCPWGEI